MVRYYILKGHICYSRDSRHLEIIENGFLICIDGESRGVFTSVPGEYEALPIKDCTDRIIVPGLVDLHAHAPQYSYCALGMDLELLDWLNVNTFPEEAKYADLEYARRAYSIYVQELRKSPVTRASIFATVHVESTIILMDLLEEAGLAAYVGKVNMDRNAPDILCEKDAAQSAKDTVRWIDAVQGRYSHIKPILTPRFIPTCTDGLMKRLGAIHKQQQIPVQSHLSENRDEIALVQELCPTSSCYGDAYDEFGLFGSSGKTIMAHCVWPDEEETELLRKRGVFVAHCPQSNTNLASGIAPVRKFMECGIPVGLGSDVAGGFSTSIFRAMADAIQCSKLRWRLVDDSLRPLTMEEAFYLGTKGGGAFFGKVGSFEAGYELDAVILDDTELKSSRNFSVKERLERLIYLSDDRQIIAKYAQGRKIYEKDSVTGSF